MDCLLFLSNALVPLVLFYMIGFGLLQKRPVLDDFLDGAKEGMKTTIKVMPTLIGLMTAVGVLRASGFLDFAGKLFRRSGQSDSHSGADCTGRTGTSRFQCGGNKSGIGHLPDQRAGFTGRNHRVCFDEQYGNRFLLPQRLFWNRSHYKNPIRLKRGDCSYNCRNGSKYFYRDGSLLTIYTKVTENTQLCKNFIRN